MLPPMQGSETLEQRRAARGSHDVSQAASSQPPAKKKRRSPLFSKAKSCLGCRRAKLRCSMKWPCANCVRRGLAHECQGPVPHERRARPANDHLPRTSTGPAPSLTALAATANAEYWRAGTTHVEADVSDELSSSPPPHHDETAIDAQPTASGSWPQYYGQSAHSSYLASSFSPPAPAAASRHRLRVNGPQRSSRTDADSWTQLDTDYTYFRNHVQQGMDGSIVEEFEASIAWMFCPVEASKLSSSLDGSDDDASALSLVAKVVVFAWRAAVQRDISAAGSERVGELGEVGEVAFQQCWRTLDQARWSRCNSLTVQQALFLLCIFLLNFKGGQMADRFSSVFGICVAKAIESGLYTDAMGGQAEDASVRRQRRRLFWELYSLDAFRSLAYCRPCFFQDNTITAAKPSVLSDDDAFHAIKYENAQIINRFMTHHLHSCRTNFQETLDLDLQVRQLFERIPSHLRVRRANRLSSGRQQTIRQILQGCTVALNIHQTLLTLYRPWFVSSTLEEARAMDGGERNSAQHQRARLCIGESASAMIDLCSRAYAADAQTTMHWAYFLHHTFNAGVCRAMQAIYGHAGDPFNHSAVDDVDEAMALLEKTQEHGRGHVWLPRAHVLRKLRQRIERAATGEARNGEEERSRRTSYLRLLGAPVPPDADPASIGGASASPTPMLGAHCGSTALLHSNNVLTATPDDGESASGWLELLNTDAFTLPFAELWNAQATASLDASANVGNTAQPHDTAWTTPLYQ